MSAQAASDRTISLDARDVTVTFGGLHALSDVSVELGRDGITALIGPNGAGKSTMFDVLSGARVPTKGSVHVDGRDVTRSGAAHRMRLGLSRTFQTPHLAASLTVQDNVLLGLHGRGWSGRRGSMVKARAALERTGLEHVSRRYPSSLSYGERKRVELARALVSEPRMVLLDEPYAGLNGNESDRLSAILERAAGEGISVVLVEHDMAVVMGLASHIIVLDFGQKLADGATSEVRQDQRVISAYLGSHV